MKLDDGQMIPDFISSALDDPRIEGRAVESPADGLVGASVGPGHVARELRQGHVGGAATERLGRVVAGLGLHGVEVDAVPE